MKVLKFGGTSVGSVENLYKIKDILVSDKDSKIVVCSAMSGITDQLVALVNSIKIQDTDAITRIVYKIENKHSNVLDAVIANPEKRANLKNGLGLMIANIMTLSQQEYSEELNSRIITYGESLLTYVFSGFLNSEGVSNVLLDAKEFMYVGSVENPIIPEVQKKLSSLLDQNSTSDLFITQGFVCINDKEEVSHLKRGGSDYTATIIGAAVDATEVEIWTDINGFHNNDPRYVDDTHPIAHLTYNEAAELAYFGAKILHPQTVSAVKNKNIPVLLKNTFDPAAAGTIISNESPEKGLKAISAKDGITAIKIKSNRMLMAHGYLRKIFEVFDTYGTSIDMITTSEVAISLTIDDTHSLPQIMEELVAFGEVTVESNYSIVCLVGESIINDKNAHKIFEVLNYIPVRMVSYGGSSNNISILIDAKDKIPALRFLNEKLFRVQFVV